MPIYELLVSIKETKDKAYCIIFILTFFNRNKKRQIKKCGLKTWQKWKIGWQRIRLYQKGYKQTHDKNYLYIYHRSLYEKIQQYENTISQNNPNGIMEYFSYITFQSSIISYLQNFISQHELSNEKVMASEDQTISVVIIHLYQF